MCVCTVCVFVCVRVRVRVRVRVCVCVCMRLHVSEVVFRFCWDALFFLVLLGCAGVEKEVMKIQKKRERGAIMERKEKVEQDIFSWSNFSEFLRISTITTDHPQYHPKTPFPFFFSQTP